jgi:hypothetical protein
MFGRLFRLFAAKDPFGYAAGDRAIFTFFDGTTARRADPLAVQRALLASPAFDNKLDPGMPGLNAAGRVAAGVRKAFGVPAFDAGGLTDAECLDLYVAFGEYVGRLAEDSRPLASSPGPTASADDDCPTGIGAASTSTAAGPPVAAAEPAATA